MCGKMQRFTDVIIFITLINITFAFFKSDLSFKSKTVSVKKKQFITIYATMSTAVILS